jgi:hypothetical protein
LVGGTRKFRIPPSPHLPRFRRICLCPADDWTTKHEVWNPTPPSGSDQTGSAGTILTDVNKNVQRFDRCVNNAPNEHWEFDGPDINGPQFLRHEGGLIDLANSWGISYWIEVTGTIVDPLFRRGGIRQICGDGVTVQWQSVFIPDDAGINYNLKTSWRSICCNEAKAPPDTSLAGQFNLNIPLTPISCWFYAFSVDPCLGRIIVGWGSKQPGSFNTRTWGATTEEVMEYPQLVGPSDTSDYFEIGTDNIDNSFEMEQLTIHDHFLTSTEIQNMWSNGNGIAMPPLI